MNLENGKIYVGKTTRGLLKRFNSHKSACRKGKNSAKLLYEDVRKYGGWENFICFEIDKAESVEELNEKEKFWIKFLRTQEIGYNIGFGGDGGDNYAYNPNIDEIKRRISEGVKNSYRWTEEKRKIQSERTSKWNMEHLDFLSERMFGEANPMNNPEYREKLKGENNPMKNPINRKKQLDAVRSEKHRKMMSELKKGKPSYVRTPEQCEAISKRMKGKKLSEETKRKISESSKGRNVSEETRNKIAKAISGIVRSEDTKNKLREIRVNKIFLQFSKDGKFIGRYLGKKELKDKTNISASNVKDIRFYPMRMTGGYKWIILRKNEVTEEEIQEICREGL